METSDNSPGFPLSWDSLVPGDTQDWEEILASMDLDIVDHGQLEQPAFDCTFYLNPQEYDFSSPDSQYSLDIPSSDMLDASLGLNLLLGLHTTSLQATVTSPVAYAELPTVGLSLAGFPPPSDVPCLSPDLFAVPPLSPSAPLSGFAEQVMNPTKTVGTMPEEWWAGDGTWTGTVSTNGIFDDSPSAFSPDTVVSPAGYQPSALQVPDQTPTTDSQIQDKRVNRRKGKRTDIPMTTREFRRLMKPVACLDKKCTSRFSYDAERNKHVNARHPELAVKENVYRPRTECRVCGGSFARPDHLRRHERKKHPPTPPGSGTGSYGRTKSRPRVLVPLRPKE